MQSEIVQSEIFNCISHSIRLKEVQTVVAVNSIPLLSLNCLILGDEPDRLFTVTIEKTKNVSVLKKLIKGEKPSRLKDIDASDLDLWRVSYQPKDFSSKSPPAGPKLRPERLLSEVFPSELDKKYIHVVACCGEYYILSFNFAHYSVKAHSLLAQGHRHLHINSESHLQTRSVILRSWRAW